MSGQLWKFYFEDDFESFAQLLEEANLVSRAAAQKGGVASQIVGPAHIGGSEGIATSPRSLTGAHGQHFPAEVPRESFHDVTLTRADVNRRDLKGMTLLHYAASSKTANAKNFALSLIAYPLVDLYAQDFENGWTALHRAFYFGNITVARAIIEREYQNSFAQGTPGATAHSGSLIKTKDREGYGPYDLLTATIADRTLHHGTLHAHGRRSSVSDDESIGDYNEEDQDESKRKALVSSAVDVGGDGVFTFGSNKNMTLGLGNQDDRQFPECVALRRPDYLFKRFHQEAIEQHVAEVSSAHPQYAEKLRAALPLAKDVSTLPSVVRAKPIRIQDVQMSKFHSAILTHDPVSNLHICGHGMGGRLGTGNEKTQFKFVCIDDFGQKRKKIVAVALGQDHTLAVTDQGELFSWGSNTHGQLGHGLSKTSVNAEEPVQLVPRQLFGTLKRELIVGVAASRIHSVAHSASALYTFGKNEGQLGIVDAHAGSLEVQSTPRRVAASRFSCAIQSVSAIDRATVCLLENHEVHVLANYGIVKLQFPLDGFSNYFLKKSFLSTRYDDGPNTICKITGGGDTLCALSTAGEIFAVTVEQRLDPGSSSTTSTTNPNKIKAALSAPARVWSLKKGHMSARDVGVDHDGSIILTTEAGSVWRRVRRASVATPRNIGKHAKVFKFMRVPGLTRVTAVRASAFGAYCAVRQDCDVAKTQILVQPRRLTDDVADMLPFHNIDAEDESETEPPIPTFWNRPSKSQRICIRLRTSSDLEKDVQNVLSLKPNENNLSYDAVIGSTVSGVQIPVHEFILAGRSRPMAEALRKYRRGLEASSDMFSLGADDRGRCLVTFQGLDFLTLVELVTYIYTDHYVGFALQTKHAPQLAFRYRQVRTELLKVASRLELNNLESAARRMDPNPTPCLDKDMEMAISDLDFFQGGDAAIELEDAEVTVHSDFISRRCPFFRGLFHGRAGGRWLAQRRERQSVDDDPVGIDMKHIEIRVFQLVLRHLYADTGEELFDGIQSKNLDEFLDLVMDVLAVANELMLDRLSQICQSVLGRYVNVRNACELLNAVAPSSVQEFKNSVLEYLCLNLEAVLTNHLLDELDEDLLHELDDVVQSNQLASLPFVRSGRAEQLLHEKFPHLAERLDRDRRAKIDAINMQMKFADSVTAIGTSFDARYEEDPTPYGSVKGRSRSSAAQNPATSSPKLRPDSSHSNPTRSPATLSPELASKNSAAAEATATFSIPPPAMSTSLGEGIGSTTPSISIAKTRELPMPTTMSGSEGVRDARNCSKESPATKPWGAAPLTSGKLGMKEIMEQASNTRRSNISLGLATQASVEHSGSQPFNTRMSQKDRRKQQQQRQVSDFKEGPTPSSSTPAVGPSKSPWQTVATPSRSTSGPSTASNPPDRSKSPSQRSVSTPQLTMRQTVANSPAAGKQKAPPSPNIAPQTPPSQPRRMSSFNSQSPTTSPSASRPIEIQSIRHQRPPAQNQSSAFSLHQSMADILSQQQAEKNVIQEAVAKRSLQEIQQEQEFLSWWDNESKKVMEEEAARAGSSGKAPGRGGRGGGRSRNRGRRAGRGIEPSTAGSAE